MSSPPRSGDGRTGVAARIEHGGNEVFPALRVLRHGQFPPRRRPVNPSRDRAEPRPDVDAAIVQPVVMLVARDLLPAAEPRERVHAARRRCFGLGRPQTCRHMADPRIASACSASAEICNSGSPPELTAGLNRAFLAGGESGTVRTRSTRSRRQRGGCPSARPPEAPVRRTWRRARAVGRPRDGRRGRAGDRRSSPSRRPFPSTSPTEAGARAASRLRLRPLSRGGGRS